MKKQRTKRAYYRAFSTSDGPAVAKIRADTPAKARILLHATSGVGDSWPVSANDFNSSQIQFFNN